MRRGVAGQVLRLHLLLDKQTKQRLLGVRHQVYIKVRKARLQPENDCSLAVAGQVTVVARQANTMVAMHSYGNK